MLPLGRPHNVFLGVHGVEGEQASGQTQSGDHVLGAEDFIAFLGDHQVAEDDLTIAGEGAQHLRRLAVVEGVEAAAQCFAIDDDAGRDRPTFGGEPRQRRRVLAENPLELRPVKPLKDET